MSFDVEKVSVVIPTTCEAARAHSLARAIASVLGQQGAHIELLVVVNGNRVDASLLAMLKNNPRLRILELAEGNVSAARYQGLLQAGGAYFCFLDDDDELLPASIGSRLAVFRQHPDTDVVSGNGVEQMGGTEHPLVPMAAERISADPAGTFLASNWFASPAPLFRAAGVDRRAFDIRHKYFEWSYLFFLLLSRGTRFRFTDALTYRLYKDTAGSASKSGAYALASAEFLREVLCLPLTPAVRKGVRHKYLSALNTLANYHLSQRQRLPAWKAHLRCLASGGLHYLLFTRHLILGRSG